MKLALFFTVLISLVSSCVFLIREKANEQNIIIRSGTVIAQGISQPTGKNDQRLLVSFRFLYTA